MGVVFRRLRQPEFLLSTGTRLEVKFSVAIFLNTIQLLDDSHILPLLKFPLLPILDTYIFEMAGPSLER